MGGATILTPWAFKAFRSASVGSSLGTLASSSRSLVPRPSTSYASCASPRETSLYSWLLQHPDVAVSDVEWRSPEAGFQLT
jgi:hypothetical protein